MNVVKAKLDIVFKKLFTSNKEVLTAFVGDILDIPRGSIQSVTVEDPEVLPETVDGKLSRLDLKLKVDDKNINVEIQLFNKGNFRERVLYYWAKLFSGELKKGEDYSLLKKTISINILNFNLFDCDEPYSKFSLLEETRREPLTDKCSIMFFELKKINDKVEKNDRKKLWLQLINAETEEELDMLEQTGVPEIKQAVVILHKLSADEEMRAMAEAREKAILDEYSAMVYAKSQGRKEDWEETAAIMREEGFTEEQIQRILDKKRARGN